MYLPRLTSRLRLGHFSCVVTCPVGRAFGPMISSLHIPAAVAAQERVPLVVVAPARSLNKFAFELCSEVIPVVVIRAPAAWLLRGVIWCAEFLRVRVRALFDLGSGLTTAALFDAARFRRLRKMYRASCGDHTARLQVYYGLDLRELLATGRRHLALRSRLAVRAQGAAARLGVPEGARLVTLHVRESGYRPSFTGHVERPIDHDRTADVADYALAIDELVGRGFTVVRIGDPTMAPVLRRGVVDLATSRDRDAQLVQIWCVSRSTFMMAGESGPSELALLLGVPMLQVNVVNSAGNYPLREYDRYLLKLPLDASGRVTRPLEEVATERFLYGGERPSFGDNTPQDLLMAVREMLDDLEHPRPASEPQLAFARLMTEVHRGPRNADRWTRKAGRIPARAGDGFISRFFAERHLRRVMGASCAPGEAQQCP